MSLVRFCLEQFDGSLSVGDDYLVVDGLAVGTVGSKGRLIGTVGTHFNVTEPLYEPPICITAHEASLTLEVVACFICKILRRGQIVEHSVSQVDDIIHAVPCTLHLTTVTLKVNETSELHAIGIFVRHVCPNVASTFEVEDGVFTSIVFPPEIVVHLVDESFNTLFCGENVLRAFRRRVILVEIARGKTHGSTYEKCTNEIFIE